MILDAFARLIFFSVSFQMSTNFEVIHSKLPCLAYRPNPNFLNLVESFIGICAINS